LLRRNPNTKTLEIYQLVQTVLKQGMDQASRCLWAERVVNTVARVIPLGLYSTWPDCERLFSQANVCVNLIEKFSFESPEAARLLNNAGMYLYWRGRYADAEPLLERALAIREKVLVSEDPDVATSLNNLGFLYQAQGKNVEAEPLYQRALSIREKALRLEDLAVPYSLKRLAGLYQTQGEYGKAEPLYQRALTIWEKALGEQHPRLAWILDGLAELYYAQGEYAEAENRYKQALALREKALGPEHRDLAWILDGLAELSIALKENTRRPNAAIRRLWRSGKRGDPGGMLIPVRLYCQVPNLENSFRISVAAAHS
jgi:tetratricopeptide (TPR) repeat protein